MAENLVVMKFGGTSVGTTDKILNVAGRVIRAKNSGKMPVVVVSAMAGQTNGLMELANQVARHIDKRELDTLLSTGETVSSALLTMALTSMGYPSRSFTGIQTGILTDDVHGNARIQKIYVQQIREAVRKDEIAVVAGFQGFDINGNITTLGRGGSDTTAVALAASLRASCEIYTDVDGVYTTDPNIVPEAQKLDTISCDEMLDMASLGAKVLHSRAVEISKNHNTPIVIRSTFNEGKGTVISSEQLLERRVVSGITLDKNQAKITVVGVPEHLGIVSTIGQVSGKGIVVDMIVQNVSREGRTDISFTVPRPESLRAYELMCGMFPKIVSEVSLDQHIAKVSLVGAGMRSQPGVAATMFETLADKEIRIFMISTSEITISVIIDEKQGEIAVQNLHGAFGLGTKT